jgi:hypothetical protein
MFAFSLRARIKKIGTTDEHGSTRIRMFRAKPPRRKVFSETKNPNPFFLCGFGALRESFILKDEAAGQDAVGHVARASCPPPVTVM